MFRTKDEREQIHENISVIQLEHFIIFPLLVLYATLSFDYSGKPSSAFLYKKFQLQNKGDAQNVLNAEDVSVHFQLKIPSERTETISDFEHVTLWKRVLSLGVSRGAFVLKTGLELR